MFQAKKYSIPPPHAQIDDALLPFVKSVLQLNEWAIPKDPKKVTGADGEPKLLFDYTKMPHATSWLNRWAAKRYGFNCLHMGGSLELPHGGFIEFDNGTTFAFFFWAMWNGFMASLARHEWSVLLGMWVLLWIAIALVSVVVTPIAIVLIECSSFLSTDCAI